MKSKKGFTLIELVISMAIIGIISVSMLNIFSAGLLNISRAGNRTVNTNTAELDYLTTTVPISEKIELQILLPSISSDENPSYLGDTSELISGSYARGVGSNTGSTYADVEVIIETFVPGLKGTDE